MVVQLRSGPSSSAERLEAERLGFSCNAEELGRILNPDPEELEKMKKLLRVEGLRGLEYRAFLNHSQMYEVSAAKAATFHRACFDLGITDIDEVHRMSFLLGIAPLPTDVHMSMFVTTIETQATEQQRRKWLPLAKNFAILGAYAQTEIGHGSNVRGLETEATYDPKTETFDLHSPRPSAAKYWPGGLGKTATHAAVYARLKIGDKDHGVHGFFVQLRSLEDHMPMPGVKVGDIGPKMGFNSVDNGFALFEHVKLPRDSMFMRFAVVHPDGRYEKVGDSRLGYASMLKVRASIVIYASRTLSKAALIATRYSAVRLQGPGVGAKEQPVLEYIQQQSQLFPVIATCYALHFLGAGMREAYSTLKSKLSKASMKTEDLAYLAEMHATTAGMKSLVTKLVCEGIETCRKILGGHGYSCFSGLPQLFGDYVASYTYEGTPEVLQQQTGRYILRILEKSAEGKRIHGSFAYLGRSEAGEAQVKWDFTQADHLLLVFENRARTTARELGHSLASEIASGTKLGIAWNRHGTMISKTSHCHCQLMILTSFLHSITRLRQKVSSRTCEVLELLARLWALNTMETEFGSFVSVRALRAEEAPEIRSRLLMLMDALRPEVIGLMESFQIPDEVLGSALGASDGDYIHHLLDFAAKEPLNAEEVTKAYSQSLKPLMLLGKSRL